MLIIFNKMHNFERTDSLKWTPDDYKSVSATPGKRNKSVKSVHTEEGEEELEFKMCFFIPPEYANKVVGFLMVWTCFTGCYDLWAQSTIKWEGEQHYRESTIGMFAFSWAITICIPRIIAVYFYG